MNSQSTFLIAAFSVLFLSGQTALASADSVVVFNEINYHPADSIEETEWIELRSLMGVDVDISGWAIDRGVSFTFPEGTIVPGRGYILVAADPGNASLSGLGAVGPFSGALANGGEEVRLVNNSGRVMDEISYGDDGDWPTAPDGAGVTLSKRNEGSSNTEASNWVASPTVGGTPGVVNFPRETTGPITSGLISLDGEWKYFDEVNAPAGNWADEDFDDSAWETGDAGFYAGAVSGNGAGVGLLGYWKLDEASGNIASNEVAAGQDAIVTGASWNIDGTRGRVLRFDGVDDFANAGTIPQQTTANDFTWSFWARDEQGASSNVILGNRFSPSGSDFSPREFIKFTTNQFEWHRGGVSAGNLDYAAIAQNIWIHHAIVKEGAILTYYRNGVASGSSTITGGMNNPQPLYFGGDQGNENWQGKLDDPAVWETALPAESIAGLADGSFSPLTAATTVGDDGLQTQLSDAVDTHYFRTSFTFNGNPARSNLTLQMQLDDGAVVYLNGVEIHRENMPDGVISHGTDADSDVSQASLGAGIALPATSLKVGSNVLAVSVHQSSATSVDMVFAAGLSSTEQPLVLEDLESQLVFNEISAATDTNFRIEIQNAGSTEVELAGYLVQATGGGSYTIPEGTLSAGESLVVSQATLGFLPTNGERVSIFRPGGVELSDSRSVSNRLRGRDSEGRWAYPTTSSFGTENVFNVSDDIVINEIMYNPRTIRTAAPAPLMILDWDAVWRYNESATDLGDTWETMNHPVGGDWESGAGPIGFEFSVLPIPLATIISRPVGRAVYFETDFTITAEELASAESLRLNHLVDDGAIFYLNGIEVERFKMDPEPTNFESFASSGGDADLITGISLPKTALVAGSNRLSVEVHQESTRSSDIVFGATLELLESFEPIVESDDQWIELYNRGELPVDLSGWEFSDGIGFDFPAGTTLDAGEYLVVARDAAALSARLPGVTVLGDWSGRLSRGGERVTLSDSTRNIVDEVRYYDDGRWSAESDGGGASLELVDPDADNNVAEAWAASDEGSRSSWGSFSYRASGMNHGDDPTNYNEFVFGLLDDGELLIDDISVVEDPDGNARQLIQNGSFGNGKADTWRLLGTHGHGAVVDDPDAPGNQVLHLATTGSTEHQYNHAETTLKDGENFVTINGSLDYEISFRAKWLSGSNQLHTRLYFNRAAQTTFLSVPDDGGTPGAPNSRFIGNAGPTYNGMLHQPAVPIAGESCQVTVSANDPDEVSSMTLWYSVNGGNFSSVVMGLLDDGKWAGSVPGQAASSKVQFYVEGVDANGASSFFPAAGPDSRAMIPYEDGLATLDLGDCQPNNFRIVMTNADRDFMHTITNVMSNDRLDCTVIWNETEIYYGCGVRLKGSQRGRPQDVRVGFNVRFPADQLFLGSHETVAIDRSGSGNEFSQKEMLVKHAINHAGDIPGMHDDLIRVIAPQTVHTSSAMLLKSRYDNEFLDNIYEDGGDGTSWEYELIYYPTTTSGGPEDLKLPNPDEVTGVDVMSLGSDPELYRWYWLIKNNREADAYDPLIEMLEAYGQDASASYLEQMDELLDVDQFLRSFAIQILFGVGDGYSSGSQHNAFFYQRPEDGRFLFLPWDMDFAFTRGATSSLTPSPDLNKLLTSPANRRAYYGHIEDLVSTTFNAGYMGTWGTHYSCFLPTEDFTGRINYISTRSSFALTQVRNVIPEVAFGVDTPNSTTAEPFFTVQGDGWVDVREIRLDGQSLPIEWINTSTYRVSLPVSPGTNTYTLEAFDFEGNSIGFDNITLTGTGSVIPAVAGSLVISEIMYDSGDESDDFEFIELLNIDSTNTLNLGGASFIDGITFTIPDGTLLAPGERLVVARNLDAYASRYGGVATVVGGYAAEDGSNKLSNGGELLELVDSLGVLIDRVDYNDKLPWPESADGDGYSLVRINPSDPFTSAEGPEAWRSSRSLNGSPGFTESDDLALWATANGITDLTLDPDKDGYSHLAEFALLMDPFTSDVPEFEGIIEDEIFKFIVRVRNGADGVTIVGEKSNDLDDWVDADYGGRLNNGDGISSNLIFEGSFAPDVREFLRVRFN